MFIHIVTAYLEQSFYNMYATDTDTCKGAPSALVHCSMSNRIICSKFGHNSISAVCRPGKCFVLLL